MNLPTCTLEEIAEAMGAADWDEAAEQIDELLLQAEELGDEELGDLAVVDLLRRLRHGASGFDMLRSRDDLRALRVWLRDGEI